MAKQLARQSSKPTKPTVSAMSAKRLAIRKEMSSELGKIADEIKDSLGEIKVGSVMGSYDAGAMIEEVMADEGRFGADSVDQISQYIGEKRDDLYELRKFANAFERDFVQKTTEREMPNGQHLTTKHWVILARMESEDTRNKVIKAIFEQSMSANDTQTYVNGLQRNNRTSSRGLAGGRKQDIPSTAVGAVNKLIGKIQNAGNYTQALDDNGFYTTIEEMPPDKVTDALLENLQEARGKIDEVTDQLAETGPKIDASIERVKTVLENREAEEDAEEEDEKPARKGVTKKGGPKKAPKAAIKKAPKGATKKPKGPKKAARSKRPAPASV